MTKPVKDWVYKCECGQCGDTVSSEDYEQLANNRETYPDSIQYDMCIQLLSHTPQDDFNIYEVQGKLCLSLMSI